MSAAPHIFDLSRYNFTVRTGDSLHFRWTTLTTYLYVNCLELLDGTPVFYIKYQLPETILYDNADGTQNIVTAYDTVSAGWTVPKSGQILQFTITASGAINDGGFVEPQLWVDGSVVWQTFASSSSAAPQTFNLTKFWIMVSAGQTVIIRWTTLAADRYLQCLERSDGTPVIQITLKTSYFAPISPACLLYTSPSPRDRTRSRMPSSA